MWFAYTLTCAYTNTSLLFILIALLSQLVDREMIIQAKRECGTFKFCPFSAAFITEGLTAEFKFQGSSMET